MIIIVIFINTTMYWSRADSI